ncbi:acyl-CoA synthetase (AMP-forming)/AMP-acid ligase II [Kitasatospora sp. MAP12-15]|uniref:class I adenylate-forming enzyme family protein n=1 Tax=unclassified Kitasatospora TaxID=2633591 RepID=UPI002474C0BD|nr:class I adenylate-forming enzyme family protein [Kitasatospora sp. MAP12-44]MDH6113892.1 acyl-CoA synthetase (AMP-forming)/AMP-acid ligase II [Kitasatospora sp. MAP12-44]
MSTQPAISVLHQLLDRAADRWPERPAVTSGEQSLTYRELDESSRRLAHWLADGVGLRRGQRLVVSAPTSTLLPVLVYAASRVGVAFSLLHEQVRGLQLEHILDDCEPALLVSDCESSLAAAELRGITALDVESAARHAFDPAFDVHADAHAALPPAPLGVDPVCLIYTSGTTSLPKAVVSTHQQMVFAIQAIQHELAYRTEDVVYSPLPLSFDYGLYQLFLAVHGGAHVWLGRPAEVGPALLANLRRSQATVLPAVPAVADALARLLRRAGDRTLPLRMLTNTGAAMPQEALAALRAAIPALRVHLMFGLTECKRATIMPADEDLTRPGSSGRALPGTEVFVVDDEGRRQPPGEVGEIVVRGPHVMAGYWRRPELNAQRFHRVEGLLPELRTGDYGWLDADGFLYFTGRRDDIYKENGFRVSATEVEAAARRLPGVDSAAVLAPSGGEPARLFVTAVDGLSAAEVLVGMREQIEEFKIPRHCLVLPELPLTGNGKVDRKALAARVREAGDVRTR